MREPSRVVAIGLVGRERLERLIGLPAFDADHGQAELAQSVKQDRRHPPGLEHDPTTARRFRQLVAGPVTSTLTPARAVPKSLLCSEEAEERVSESNRDGRDGRLHRRVLCAAAAGVADRRTAWRAAVTHPRGLPA